MNKSNSSSKQRTQTLHPSDRSRHSAESRSTYYSAERSNKRPDNSRSKSEQENSKNHENDDHAFDQRDILSRSVLRSGLSYESFVKVLIESAFSRLNFWTQADLERLLVLAERLGLDPLGHEIYAVQTQVDANKKSNIIFVVGVDGWSKIINSHPQFDGMRFMESAPGDDELPQYFECTIFRKDRKIATSVREYLYEVHTNQGAWLTHPRRMLRHKAMVQCARVCFGLSGVYDPDEAQRISENTAQTKIKNSGDTPSNNKSDSDSSKVVQREGKNIGSKFVKHWVKKHTSHNSSHKSLNEDQ